MTAKEFIRKVLIKEIGEIHEDHPYISFALMALGVEFLGKCLNDNPDWNQSWQSKADFERAINNLVPFERYKPLLSSHELWTSLRNGMLHSFVPKSKITLSCKAEVAHLKNASESSINLRCEDFYNDFKNACEEVLKIESPKVDSHILIVPSDNPSGIQYSGSTFQ